MYHATLLEWVSSRINTKVTRWTSPYVHKGRASKIVDMVWPLYLRWWFLLNRKLCEFSGSAIVLIVEMLCFLNANWKWRKLTPICATVGVWCMRNEPFSNIINENFNIKKLQHWILKAVLILEHISRQSHIIFICFSTKDRIIHITT